MTFTGRRNQPIESMAVSAGSGGHIYVISFDNGTIKVGSTSTPNARFRAHQSDASAYDVNLIEWWLSTARPEYLIWEARLIQAVATMGGRRARREYFHDLNFGPVVAAAKAIVRGEEFSHQAPTRWWKTCSEPAPELTREDLLSLTAIELKGQPRSVRHRTLRRASWSMA